MPEVVKTVLVPYSASEMFGLVSDVASYPSFLPWCGGSSVASHPSGRVDQVLATVVISFKGIRQGFTTVNANTPPGPSNTDTGTLGCPGSIHMTLHDGPFKSLEGHWTFIPLAESACKVSFQLDYHFSSRLLETLIGPVFQQITGSFVDAFVRRAEQLHGPR